MIHTQIEMVQGKDAPKYDGATHKEMMLEKVVITEQGTKGNLPIVDLVLTDKDGNKVFVATTGRIVNMISAAIKGANLRNHGIEEP